MSAETVGIGHNRLGDRAEAIRSLIAESDAAALTSINKAIEAGHALAEAKTECGHGEWLPFLERAGVKERRARQYMQLASSGLKSATVADFGGIRGALEFLAKREKASKALMAAYASSPIELSELAHALDLIDECAMCFP